jgi:hypothetical protein
MDSMSFIDLYVKQNASGDGRPVARYAITAMARLEAGPAP